jgi:hypothetical protein
MSLWGRLGFSENPYFTTPISIGKSGTDLFVGRGSEIRRLMNKWDEKDGAITILGGNIGTGKTSFLNVCQYLCMTNAREFGLTHEPPRLLPAFSKVQLETAGSDEELLLKIIESAAISIRKTCEHLKVPVPDKVDRATRWLRGVSNTPQLTEGRGVRSAPESGTKLQSASGLSVQELLGELENLAQIARGINEFRGIIVAIDNIEMVDSDEVVKLLNRYRDTIFSASGVWWVLIGQRGLFDLIDAEAPRVTQRVKGTETTLEGLSWEDFLLAIQVRIEQFRLRSDAVAPIGEDLLRKLFTASSGEIRYVFKMADEIVTDAIADDPSLQNVPPEIAERMLRRSVAAQIARLGLTDPLRRVLRILCERASVRPKEYKEYGFQNAPNFLQGVLQPLQEKGLVGKSTQGNAAVYAPRPLGLLWYQFEKEPSPPA